jgi:hypothetical protein
MKRWEFAVLLLIGDSTAPLPALASCLPTRRRFLPTFRRYSATAHTT